MNPHINTKVDQLRYWLHEGPEDESDDEELVTEAVEILRAYQGDKSAWMSLEDFEAELAKERRIRLAKLCLIS